MKAPLPCLLALLVASLPAAAQSPAKLPLFFKVEDTDAIGQRVTYAVRDRLRRASNIALTNDESAAWMVAVFLSVPIPDGTAAAYSLVTKLNDRSAWSGTSYWTSMVGTCGTNVTDKCAKSVMDSIDEAVTGFQAEYAHRLASQPAQPAKKP